VHDPLKPCEGSWEPRTRSQYLARKRSVTGNFARFPRAPVALSASVSSQASASLAPGARLPRPSVQVKSHGLGRAPPWRSPFAKPTRRPEIVLRSYRHPRERLGSWPKTAPETNDQRVLSVPVTARAARGTSAQREAASRLDMASFASGSTGDKQPRRARPITWHGVAKEASEHASDLSKRGPSATVVSDPLAANCRRVLDVASVAWHRDVVLPAQHAIGAHSRLTQRWAE